MPIISDNILIDGSLRLAAQQWASLGVSLRCDDAPPKAVIDPEALLWFTLEIGRYDQRLFDEVVDWLIINHEHINTARLQRIGPDKNDIRWSALAAVASHIYLHKKPIGWKKLAESQKYPLLPPTPFFLFPSGKATALPAHEDSEFLQRGFIRGKFEPRGLSKPFKNIASSRIPAALLLRAKDIFGSEAKAYLWTALFVRNGCFQSELAERTGYTIPLKLDGFIRAGVCVSETRKIAKYYTLKNCDEWRKILQLDEFIPPWPNWLRFFHGLTSLIKTISILRQEHSPEYIFASKLREQFITVKDDFPPSDFAVKSPMPDNFLIDEFKRRFDAYIAELLNTCLFATPP